MTEEEFFEEHPAPLYWLSFVDPSRPAGQRSLGACVVRTAGHNHLTAFAEAIQEAWRQGCNPGGECKGVPVPDESIPEEHRNRLMAPKEIVDLDLGVKA